jgi:hypothetical protein
MALGEEQENPVVAVVAKIQEAVTTVSPLRGEVRGEAKTMKLLFPRPKLTLYPSALFPFPQNLYRKGIQ